MRQQRAFSFMVGYPVLTDYMKIQRFQTDVVRSISLVYGGCETTHTSGWWRDDGAKHVDEFTGELHREKTISFNFTSENHKAEKAYRAASRAITLAAQRHDIDTDWVHVKETRVLGRHFSIKEATNEAAP